MATNSQGRVPQGEVVMDFADGGQYIKAKLEDAALALERRKIERSEAAKAARAMQALEVKAPAAVDAKDVEYLIKELGVSREEAEGALREGGVAKAVVKLTAPGRR